MDINKEVIKSKLAGSKEKEEIVMQYLQANTKLF